MRGPRAGMPRWLRCLGAGGVMAGIAGAVVVSPWPFLLACACSCAAPPPPVQTPEAPFVPLLVAVGALILVVRRRRGGPPGRARIVAGLLIALAALSGQAGLATFTHSS